MGKKIPENKFGVQVEDIFCEQCGFEDEFWIFYQVAALKGTQTVVLRQIEKCCTAFDSLHTSVVPVPDAWVTKDEYVKRVIPWSDFDGREENRIYLKSSILFPYRESKVYTEATAPVLAKCFEHRLKEYAADFDVREGSGVFALEGAIYSIYDEIPVVVRYPDRTEERRLFHELYLQGERVIDWDGRRITYASHCRSQCWIHDCEEIFCCRVGEQEEGTPFTVSCTLSVEEGSPSVRFGTGKDGDRIEEEVTESGTFTRTLQLKQGEAYVRIVNTDREHPFAGDMELEIELSGVELSDQYKRISI